MGNFISIIISWTSFAILFMLMLATGLTMYQAQELPNYRQTVNRTIMYTGRLDQETITNLEKSLHNKVQITRVTSAGKAYTDNNRDTPEDYGTRVDYTMTVNAFGFGNIAHIKTYNAGHFFTVTEVNDTEDSPLSN